MTGKADVGARIRTFNMTPDDALSAGAIESGIRPLVEVLNSVGDCQTIASCHGHGDVLFHPWVCVPYILFRAPLSFAKALQQQLDPSLIGRSQGTHYHWELSAKFHPDDYGLAWTLAAHSIQLPEALARRRLDADIHHIADMVRRSTERQSNA